MKAIRIHESGGPEALRLETLPDPAPGPGQALVRIRAAGVNFIDVYFRTGRYPAELPFTLGQEGAGVVERVGDGVTLSPGTRVGWAGVRGGSYADLAVLPADKLVPLPDGITEDVAASVLLQGMTAHYLAHSTYAIRPGDRVLVHAAAGGVGLLLVQIAKRLGATVFGTVSTEEKAKLAREAGADEVILYTKTSFKDEVLRLTGGAGVHAVYDSVGKTTFDDSLASLRMLGTLALFGASSGAVPPFDPMALGRASLFLTRPRLHDYVHHRQDLLRRAGDVLGWVGDGSLNVRIDRTYPLEEAAQAHRDLEGRKTAGKLLLQPVRA